MCRVLRLRTPQGGGSLRSSRCGVPVECDLIPHRTEGLGNVTGLTLKHCVDWPRGLTMPDDTPWKRVFERGPDDKYEPPLDEPAPSKDARAPSAPYLAWWEKFKRALEDHGA
jgi:hypothetical protein